MLELCNLTKKFGDVEAVRNVSISAPDRAFLVLLGPSGCGKTTLLRMLAGLEMPTSGKIKFNSEIVSDGDHSWSVDPAKRNSGLVFQSYALWPHMTVRGNVEWPLKVAGMARAERLVRVDEVLQLLDISELSGRYPNEISGGQQQRVAIARTIAPRPQVLLFDEPLSNLDAKLRVEMRTELMRLHRTIEATTVYVTHDQIEAMTMASHIAVMNEGRVEQFDRPHNLVQTPATSFVATFIGTPPSNLVPVVNDAAGFRLHTRHMPIKPPTDEFCLAMYRAETLEITCEEREMSLPMEIAEVSQIAGRTMVTTLDDGLRVTAIVDTLPKADIGEQVHVAFPVEPACWFGEDGTRIGR